MIHLIDGNNLLHATHAHLPVPPVGRQQLCALLGRWARQRGTDLTVVFDGPRPRAAFEQQMQAMGVTVIFGASRSADEVIEEMIELSPVPGEIHLVTSDRAIQSVARHRRCACIESADFARELVPTSPSSRKREPPPTPQSEKPDTLPPEETDEWIRRFKFDPDQPPDDLDLIRY